MNVTPATMVRQINAARAAVPFGGDRLAYSTKTGDVRKPERVEIWDDYCFICSRATDHMGEHYDVAEVSTQRTETFLSSDGKRLYVTHTTRTKRAEGPGMPWEEMEKRINWTR